MKILTSPSSGSIAGVTYSHGRAGQYTRNRRSPCQPVGSGRRGVIRAAFGAASSAWAALSSSVQAAWVTYADGHPYVDALGQAIKLTGHQMYVAINTQLINCGAAQSAVIPVSDTVFSAQFSAFTAVHAGAISLTPSGLGGATDFLLIGVSRPQSGGRGFCRTFWQYGHVAGNSVTPVVMTALFKAQFGDITVGQRIFYRLTPVNQYGVTGTPNEGFIVVSQSTSAPVLGFDFPDEIVLWSWGGPDPALWHGMISADGFTGWSENFVCAGNQYEQPIDTVGYYKVFGTGEDDEIVTPDSNIVFCDTDGG